jgi:hypothetical protein
VPGLVLQWESLLDTGRSLEDKVKALVRCWLDANVCGRVLVLCDGHSVAKGMMGHP